ncbi:OLC1v1013673C1 [Oldenlandia corymbosa var. corymbosa]|uniref:OLC1v1013673C1 n=1 Tax=Oldenlandia corymbosa var. corymbosa TaxID=529605 RepID=A0AAV1DYZ0_OLDCO|nr:OLC1v1013673C1 [Oldenlandia corymbosa var. corymbosa]
MARLFLSTRALRLWVDVLDGFLAVIVETGEMYRENDGGMKTKEFITIWTMMEYGIDSSWMKKYDIEPFDIPCKSVGWWNNEKLMFCSTNIDDSSSVYINEELTSLDIREAKSDIPKVMKRYGIVRGKVLKL